MNILLLSDLHGRVEGLERIAKGRDVVLLAGDITNFGGIEKAQTILSILESNCSAVLGVVGNCDPPEIREQLQSRGFLLDERVVEVDNYCIVGAGGTEPASFNRQKEYPNSSFYKVFQKIKPSLKKEKPLLFVSHQPPFRTLLDQFAPDRHTGSLAIRTFIEEMQPILAVSGHLHEARGTDKIGKTILVNPGPFKDGYYATAEIDGTCVNITFLSI